MKIEITETELQNIGQMANSFERMLSGLDEEVEKRYSRYIRLVDRLLEKNGYERIGKGAIKKVKKAARP